MKDSHAVTLKNQHKKQRVTFAVNARDAHAVFVTGSFCDWNRDCFPLKKDKRGNWKATLPVGPGPLRLDRESLPMTRMG